MALKKQIIFLYLLYFISNKVPEYTEIKDQRIFFHLNNSDSSFYAFMKCSDDYEPEEDKPLKFDYQIIEIFYHYFFLDKKIGFKSDIIATTENENIFPDESIFNKSSNITESEYTEIDKNIDLGRYFRCRKEQINNTLIFVFYLKDKNDFNQTKEFWIERVKYNGYLKEGILNFNLEPLQVHLYKIPVYYELSNRFTIFTNSPFSTLFLREVGENISLYQSNLNLYYYLFDNTAEIFPDTWELFIVIYNPDNFTRNINMELKVAPGLYNFRSLSIDYFNREGYTYFEYISLVCIFGKEPGLFNISDRAQKYLFNGNIENIKNLTDLKSMENYRLISNGIIYSPKSFIILLIVDMNEYNYLYVSSPSIEDKGTEVSDLNFTYFKITQNNSIIITPKYPEQPYIIKLVSENNGIVIINNKVYNFTQDEIKIIEPNQKLNITSLNNHFIFAIKLQVLNNLIEYGKIGKEFIVSNNTDNKFIIFKFDNLIKSVLNIYIKYKNYVFYNYELVKDLNEIQKKYTESINYFFLDLSYCKKFDLNASCYLFIYFENITLNNPITIEITD